MSQSTNSDAGALTGNMKRLSLSTAAATALPASSPVAQTMAPDKHGSASPSGKNSSTKPPLRKTPSSSSIGSNERSTTPSLHSRTSLSSLQGAGGVTPPRSPAIRRISSHLASSPNTAMGGRSSLPPPPEEPSQPPLTSASVARDFFEKELETHHAGDGSAQDLQAVVILQDDCYGHRFSRPRTSRANLSTIVERPERIHASLLGLATAYVRLGGRHAGGHAAPHPGKHSSSLPPPPFRIQKTTRRLPLRSPAATAIHGAQWMGELGVMCDTAESKLALSGKELTRPSAAGQSNGNDHIEKPKLHEGDLYLCSGSLKALEGALGGVCEGIDTVFEEQGPKRAFVCIRPPGHHCSADMPSGFCWLNNIHVGIGHAVLTHGLTHAAIIDFDLHHGDGSQSIAWAHNSRVATMPKNTPISKKTAIGYFSLHDINSYPCEMGDEEKVRNASLCIENAHGQNIWNVHLQSWKTEAEFWQLYEDKYSIILTKARDFLRLHSEKLRQSPTRPKPKAAIFLSAGFDASEWESPGMQRHQVNVPTTFYARLTRDVVTIAEEEGLGVEGRIISVLEGGYSDRALMSGVLSHISGLAVSIGPSKQRSTSNGLGQEMSRRLGKIDINGDGFPALANGMVEGGGAAFDQDWWSLPRLEEIETLINPLAPATAPKKPRTDIRPTYTSATQSYTAKIISPPQGRRSFSGPGANQHSVPISKPPSPPPPAVDWVTAAHELSKLLVPSDRETRSCKPEDLNAEASRARRDRYSTAGLHATLEAPVTDVKRMQLRDRRGKTPHYGSDDDEEKPLLGANRRKTIADVSLLAEDVEPESLPQNQSQPVRHTRRRSSIASNASSMTAQKDPTFDLGSVADKALKREPLVIKKSRPPANPRPGTTKPKTIQKQPPVPRFPSTSSMTTMLENDPVPTPSAHGDPKADLSVNDDLKSKDVDQLASSMRTMSIKLNVPPREEYDSRETKTKGAPRGRPTKSAVPRVPKKSSPIKAKAKAVKDLTSSSPLPIEPSMEQQAFQHVDHLVPVEDIAVAAPRTPELPEQPAASEAAAELPTSCAPTSKPDIPTYKNATNSPAKSSTVIDTEDEGRVEMPRQAPQPAVLDQQQSPEATYPKTPITTIKRSKQDLPIFTATSPISFAKPNALPSGIDQTMLQDHPPTSNPKRDVPLPPSELIFVPVQPRPKEPMSQEQHTIAQSSNETNAKTESELEVSASIWDVPDTPQLRKS